MMLRLLSAFLLLCLSGMLTVGLENSLEQLLDSSQRLDETRLQRDIARIGADEVGVNRLPELYLQAPSAYSIDLPPDGNHSWQAQLGVRQQLPFGIGTDVSYQHGLQHRKAETIEATEFSEEEVIPGGFIHSLSVQAGVTIPLYTSRTWNLPALQRTTAYERADTAFSRDRTQLVRAFLSEWFSLYRRHLEVEQARRQEEFALSAVQLQEQLVERGEQAPHTLWEYQRSAHDAERERVQLKHAFARAAAELAVRHGVEFPDIPRLPDDQFSWQRHGVAPLFPAEQRILQLDTSAETLSHQRSRQSSAPQLSLSYNLSGPTQETAGPLPETFTDQFGDFDDWTPSLSVGFTLSSRDLQSAVRENRRHSLTMQLTALETSHRLQQYRTEIEQLSLLYERYQLLYERESDSLQRMQQYYQDMQQQHERGQIDTHTLQEIELSLSDMQTALSLTQSHLSATRLELGLLTGGHADK